MLVIAATFAKWAAQDKLKNALKNNSATMSLKLSEKSKEPFHSAAVRPSIPLMIIQQNTIKIT